MPAAASAGGEEKTGDPHNGDSLSDEDLLRSFEDNSSGVWSMVLEFPGEHKRQLYVDCGFFSYHSRFVEGYLQNLRDVEGGKKKPEATTFPIVITIPRMFSPGCVAVEDIRDALASLYFPERFPLRKDRLRRIAEVADYFDIPLLLQKCDGALISHLKRFMFRQNGSPMKFMWYGEAEWNELLDAMLLADRFTLKGSWSRIKQGLLYSLDDVGQLIDHKDFRKLSAHSQLDVLEGCVRKHIQYARHNWK